MAQQLDLDDLRKKFKACNLGEALDPKRGLPDFKSLIFETFQPTDPQNFQNGEGTLKTLQEMEKIYGSEPEVILHVTALRNYVSLVVVRAFPDIVWGNGKRLTADRVNILSIHLEERGVFVYTRTEPRIIQDSWNAIGVKASHIVRPEHFEKFTPVLKKKISFFSKKYGMSPIQEQHFLWLLETQFAKVNYTSTRNNPIKTTMKKKLNSSDNTHYVARIAATDCVLDTKVLALHAKLDESLIPSLSTMPLEWLQSIIGQGR